MEKRAAIDRLDHECGTIILMQFKLFRSHIHDNIIIEQLPHT